MSQPKTVEQQLKEAIEASKQTLALSEQVTALASEKEALSKRLAEIETSLAPKATDAVADSAVIKQLAMLVAEREAQAKQIAELQAQAKATQDLVAQAAKAGKGKADLNKYVERQLEEGEEGNSPAEKQHLDAGHKVDDEEACGPGWDKKGKKSKKASKAEHDEEHDEEHDADELNTPMTKKASKKKAGWDEGDFGDLDDEEVEMIKQYRNMNAEAKAAKGKKKADATLANPNKEEGKDFDKEIPQPGLDPAKNDIDDQNTTSPSMAKKAKKSEIKYPNHPSPGMRPAPKGETDVEEIIESPDMQKKEDAEGGEENETHERTLSKPEKGAKKAENSIGGMNKQDVTGQPDQDEEESYINKKDAKKGKKAEEADLAPVAAEAPKTPEAVIEEAVQKFAAIAAAKAQAETELSSLRGALAAETTAKTEAHASMKALSDRLESLMAKVAQIEASDRSVEMKAAKAVAATAVEPMQTVMNEAPEKVAKSDAEILAEFESIKNPKDQNKFFNANRPAIERAAQITLKGKRS